jgi:hypothetical protein
MKPIRKHNTKKLDLRISRMNRVRISRCGFGRQNAVSFVLETLTITFVEWLVIRYIAERQYFQVPITVAVNRR